MLYYSKNFSNFRNFVEHLSPGAFTTDKADMPTFDGKTYPQVTLEFPTVTKRGEVLNVKVKGANYCILINGGVTVLIPRKTYHKKYNRLPRAKTVNHSGDMVSAVFYRHKQNNQKNYSLKDFSLDSLR